ncbi:MAG: GspH/FimT family pseudopilin [Methylococcales bacterium]
MDRKISSQGFTLIELVVTLTVATILLAVGIPSYKSTATRNHIESLMSDLTRSLNLARSEALKRGMTVTVCKSADQLVCGGNWSNGWILFNDKNKNGSIDVGDELLHTHGAIAQGLSLKYAAFPSSNYVQFLGSGFTKQQNGTFTACGSAKKVENARAVIVHKTGRARPSIDSDRDGIYEKGSGNPLTC